MKAIVYHKYGPPEVLKFAEVEKPAPKADEVLVKVHAGSINPFEWHFMRGKPYFMRLMGSGLFKPKHKILGADLAGRVEAVGSNVRQFQPGDAVFGASGSQNGLGAFAEYACVPEEALALKPANITFEEAAAVPIAAITALQGLRDEGQLQAGQKVLINGASGGVGTYAVQIAKAFGAEVTGVCSTSKMDLVSAIGADHVIDYTQEDVTQNGHRYDLILDNALQRSILDYQRILNPGGRYVLAGGSIARIAQTMLLKSRVSRDEGKKVSVVNAKITGEALATMQALLEEGKVVSVIDRRYPLNETAEAIRYLEAGHARGKVVINIAQNGTT